MYCKYLDKAKYEVHYFCFDRNLPKLSIDEVTVHYVPIKTNRIETYINFLWQLSKYLKNHRIDLIFHINAKYALLIRIICMFHTVVFDIRTGALSKNSLKLKYKNFSLLLYSLCFRRITIISESLRHLLLIPKKKVTIIPLGGERQNLPEKDFSQINLLYVGTLNKRNIHETIVGLASYIKKYKPSYQIRYDIIGHGYTSTTDQLKKTILDNKLEDIVQFHGRKQYNELTRYYRNSNIGVVYVPQKKYYQCQPSTKLFEFLLAGMPVIATNTYENRIALKKNCGVISEDNPAAFAEAIKKLMQHTDSYKSKKIQARYNSSVWENIVNDKLQPYFEKIFDNP